MTDTEPSYLLSITLPIREIVRYLIANLGLSLTAHTAGANPRTVAMWDDGLSSPRQEMALRLRDAVHVFGLIRQADGADTARVWFIGLNPMLGDEAPATAIRNGRARDVLIAARSFLVTS